MVDPRPCRPTIAELLRSCRGRGAPSATDSSARGRCGRRAGGGARPRRAVKPKLRGWLHPGAVPVALVAGIVLVVLARGTARAVASRVYAVTAALLFGVSAIYHRGHWSPRTARRAQAPRPRQHLPDHRRHLHAVQPCSCSHGGRRTRCCWIVWSARWRRRRVPGAAGSARRAGSTPRSYVALGWVAVFFLPDFLAGRRRRRARPARRRRRCSTRVGGVVYALKRPNPSPRVVRLPRGVPRAHPGGVRRAVRRRLDRRLLRLTSPSRRSPDHRPEPASGRPGPLGAHLGARLLHRRAQLAEPVLGVAARPAGRTRPARPSGTGRRRPRPACRAPAARAGAAGSSPAPTACVNSSRRSPTCDAPGHLAAGAVLELAGDLDALLAGVLAELLDPAGRRRPPARRPRRPRRCRAPRSVPTTVISSRSTVTSTGAVEPVLRQPAGQPAADRLGVLVAQSSCNDDYTITSNVGPARSAVRLTARTGQSA